MAEKEEICTLRIFHLPPLLSDERRDQLCKHFGAVKTKTIRQSQNYTITFAEFPTKEQATEICARLHQLEVKRQRLKVDFAKRNVSVDDKENITEDPECLKKEAELSNNKLHFQSFLKKLNNWAPHHLLTQPIPPNLRYKYPPPTKATLLRIAIQLVKEPAFYTQVLHLMNKMCLPPPFQELEDEFPSIKEAYDVENYQDLFGTRVESQFEAGINQQFEEDGEEESEMESDNESGPLTQLIIPVKRKQPQSSKRLKIPKFVNPLKQPMAHPSTSQKQRPEDMFELPNDPRHRKIVLKPVEVTTKSIETAVEDSKEQKPQEIEVTEGFGLIFPAKKDNKDEENKEGSKPDFITTEQLEENRIKVEDQRVYPVFKNYHPGKPSCRLYIKNLAKQVEEADLHFIYRRYVSRFSESQSKYNVRLMQEGRMKGQAFVTLPNVAQAQIALTETNGFMLKDKPMVVQFAKIAKN